MTIINEYLSYLSEEEDKEEKKSKWKDRLKKYGKYAAGAAAVGVAAYAGSKVVKDKIEKKKHPFKYMVKKKVKKVLKNRSKKEKSWHVDYDKKKADKAARKAEKRRQAEKRHKRNVETTKSKYDRWKKERERGQDKITRQRWLDKLQNKLKSDESKKPGWFERRRNKKKEKGVVSKLKTKVGLDD